MNIKSLYEQKRAKLDELKTVRDADEFNEVQADALIAEVGEIDKKIRSLQEADNVLLKQIEKGDREFPDEQKSKGYVPLRDRLDAFYRGYIIDPEGNKSKNRGYFGSERDADVIPLVSDDISKGAKWDPEKRSYDWNKTVGTGGYLVPTLMGDYIGEAQAYIGGMVSPGLTKLWKRVASGAATTFPVVDDTSTYGAVVGQSTALTSGTDVTYAQDTLTFYKITSHIATIANELIQDAVFDVVDHVTGIQMKRLYRGLNRYFTIGTGSSQPYGLHAISTKGVDASTTRGVTRDNILDLIYSVNRAYRGPNSYLMMSDATVGYIRKMAVSATYAENTPVWQDSMQAGEPMRLEGWPVLVNSEMDDLEAYNFSMFFGDFSKFVVAEALPMKVVDLTEYYKVSDQRGYAILGRWASNLIAADAPIKHIRQPST